MAISILGHSTFGVFNSTILPEVTPGLATYVSSLPLFSFSVPKLCIIPLFISPRGLPMKNSGITGAVFITAQMPNQQRHSTEGNHVPDESKTVHSTLAHNFDQFSKLFHHRFSRDYVTN